MGSPQHYSRPYRFTLRSHPAEIAQTTEDVCHFCARQAETGAEHKLRTDSIDGLRLVLTEALNNIAEHSYGNKTDQRIAIALFLDVQPARLQLTVQLRDSGRFNKHGTIPKALHIDPEKPFELPEGGFGLNIMQQLCEELRYYRENEQNYFELQLVLEYGRSYPKDPGAS
ncbi:MAG: ATP-binding protein [Cyclonatronaceae bacterium]